jgi:hypothetical protein
MAWNVERSQWQNSYDALSSNGSVEELQSLHNKINAELVRTLTSQQQVRYNDVTDRQTVIRRLHKEIEKKDIDLETAIARNEILRSSNSAITSHKLFLLNRPIRRERLPYIWLLSVLFIGIGLCIFYTIAPSVPVELYQWNMSYVSFSGILSTFFENRTIMISLLCACITVIVMLSLKTAGIL